MKAGKAGLYHPDGIVMFEFNVFSGMKPALALHLLEQGQAEKAVNCLLESGEIRPLGGPGFVDYVPGKAATIFRYCDEWLIWPERVTLREGPIAGDSKKRIYGTDAQGAFVFCSEDETEANSLVNRYALGVPAPVAAPAVAVSGTPEDGAEIVSRAYVYTLVSDLGEEGPPSAPSQNVEVQKGQTVTIAGMNSSAAGYRPVSLMRIYRTVTGTETTEFQFVSEVQAGESSYTDTKVDSDLAEVLPSRYWIPAPEGLSGLTALPGNMFAGFKGNEIFLSEPGYPHAWPDGYSMSVPHRIVAMEAAGNTLVVLTEANVHTITVDDPALAVPSKLDGYLPCTSAAGVAASPLGVIFPSLDGLYLVEPGAAPRRLTSGVFTEKDWRKLQPETFNAVWYAGQYICFHAPSNGFVFNPSSLLLSNLGFHCKALAVEPEGRLLHVAYPVVNRTAICLWDGSEFTLRSQWVSGEMRVREPINMEAAVLVADYDSAPEYPFLKEELQYSCLGSEGAGSVCLGGDSQSIYRNLPKGEVHFVLKADGREVYFKKVTGPEPFILPAGYLATRFQMEITTDIPVSRVAMATGLGDLL